MQIISSLEKCSAAHQEMKVEGDTNYVISMKMKKILHTLTIAYTHHAHTLQRQESAATESENKLFYGMDFFRLIFLRSINARIQI